MTAKPQTFIFREPQSIAELEDMLKVRYKAFLNSDARFAIKLNEYELDIDEFDYYSHFVGVFSQENKKQTVVGAIRLIAENKGKYVDWLNQILGKRKNIKVNQQINFPFSMIKYCEEKRQIIVDFIQKEENRNLEKKEASRISIDKSVISPNLSFALIEAAFAFFLKPNNLIFINVKANTSRIYQNYGFSVIENTLCSILDTLYQPHFVTYNMIPPSFLEKFKKMQAAYRETGQICYHTDQPDNYYLEKYQTETQ